MNHTPITFGDHKVAWIRDKVNTAFNNKAMYFAGAIPAACSLLGLIAQLVQAIRGHAISDLIYVTIAYVLLFVYGVINMFLVVVIQRSIIRSQRHEQNYRILHRDVVEVFRDYRAKQRAKPGGQSSAEITDAIKTMLHVFACSYMRLNHDDKVAATVKYIYKSKLYPIRLQPNHRDGNPESVKSSPVYNVIVKKNNRQSYVYVKNLMRLDKCESDVIDAESARAIANRSHGKYSTFLAIPIVGGDWSSGVRSVSAPQAGHVARTGVTMISGLGMLGFDHPKPYALGNLYQHEIDAICCFADLLSEPLEDLNVALTNEEAKGGKRGKSK